MTESENREEQLLTRCWGRWMLGSALLSVSAVMPFVVMLGFIVVMLGFFLFYVTAIKFKQKQPRDFIYYICICICIATVIYSLVFRDFAFFMGACGGAWFLSFCMYMNHDFLKRNPSLIFLSTAFSVFGIMAISINLLFLISLILFAACSSAFFIACHLENPGTHSIKGTIPPKSTCRNAFYFGMFIMLPALLFPYLFGTLSIPFCGAPYSKIRWDSFNLESEGYSQLNHAPAMWIKSENPLYMRGKVYMYYAQGKWHHYDWEFDGVGAVNGEYKASATINDSARLDGVSTGQSSSVSAPTPPSPRPAKTEKIEVILNDTGTNYIFVPHYTFKIKCPTARVIKKQYGQFEFKKEILFPARYNLSYSIEPEKLNPPETAPEEESDDSVFLEFPGSLERLKKLALSITKNISTERDKINALGKYLQRKCRYNLNPAYSYKYNPSDKDPLEKFVFEIKEGNCRHFATALALMTRSIGIPSRVVSGFSPGQYKPFIKLYLVRFSNAHAWIEAKVDGKWLPFDATPPFLLKEPWYGRWLRNHFDFLNFKWLSFRQSLSRAIIPTPWGRKSNLLQVMKVVFPFLLFASIMLFLFYSLYVKKSSSASEKPSEFLFFNGKGNLYEQMLHILNKIELHRKSSETPYEFQTRINIENKNISSQTAVITEWFYLYKYSNREIEENMITNVKKALDELIAIIDNPN